MSTTWYSSFSSLSSFSSSSSFAEPIDSFTASPQVQHTNRGDTHRHAPANKLGTRQEHVKNTSTHQPRCQQPHSCDASGYQTTPHTHTTPHTPLSRALSFALSLAHTHTTPHTPLLRALSLSLSPSPTMPWVLRGAQPDMRRGRRRQRRQRRRRRRSQT